MYKQYQQHLHTCERKTCSTSASQKKVPEVLQILNPLKEADSHTPTIGIDVRQHCDASLPQYLVTLQSNITDNAYCTASFKNDSKGFMAAAKSKKESESAMMLSDQLVAVACIV